MRSPAINILTAIALTIGLAAGTGAALGGPGDAGRANATTERLARMTRELDLSPEQQGQVRTIIEEERAAAARLRADARQRIDAVLTDAQRARLQARMQQGIDRQLERLNRRLHLTPEQGAQAREVLAQRRADPDLTRAEFRERLAAILTPEQRRQLAAMERRGARPDERRPGPPDGPAPSPEPATAPH